MRKHTILFLIDMLNNLGGAEKNLIQIINGLDSTKYNFIVCCIEGGKLYNELKDKKINIVNFNLKKIYDIKALKSAIKLVKIIRKEKVEIMITYFEASDYWGSLIGKIAKVPILISSRRDMGHNLKKRHRLIYRILNPLFDRIITVSDSVKEMIIGQENVKPDKIVTIYNGVESNHNKIEINTAEIQKSLKLDRDKYVIIMIANMHWVKGHEYFLSAAAEIIRKNKDVQFLLAGTGEKEYVEKLMNLTKELGIREHVIFAGHRSDVPTLLSISYISVLSSINEGFSNVILESMAFGKPVIATKVGGNKELVEEGATGFLVTPCDSVALAEAILRLLNDKELHSYMSIKSKERVKKYFTYDRMINNIDRLLESLLIDKTS